VQSQEALVYDATVRAELPGVLVRVPGEFAAHLHQMAPGDRLVHLSGASFPIRPVTSIGRRHHEIQTSMTAARRQQRAFWAGGLGVGGREAAVVVATRHADTAGAPVREEDGACLTVSQGTLIGLRSPTAAEAPNVAESCAPFLQVSIEGLTVPRWRLAREAAPTPAPATAPAVAHGAAQQATATGTASMATGLATSWQPPSLRTWTLSAVVSRGDASGPVGGTACGDTQALSLAEAAVRDSAPRLLVLSKPLRCGSRSTFCTIELPASPIGTGTWSSTCGCSAGPGVPLPPGLIWPKARRSLTAAAPPARPNGMRAARHGCRGYRAAPWPIRTVGKRRGTESRHG